ncbi:MAG: alpha/beta hydrolase [Gammaproteobacteria bacterium]|nr:alpha/beta hydrolase [Gammaproteobacteria bacterium]
MLESVITISKFILFALLAYVVVGLCLYLFQRTFIYFPVPAVQHEFTEQTFENDGEAIRVVAINGDQSDAILYFGGNAEAVVYSAQPFSEHFPKHAIYLVNYRGYGGSSGTPTEQAIYSDALIVFDELNNKHSSISIVGRSLGSAVATFVASEREVDRLVLVTPFDSVQAIAQSQFPIYPAQWLVKDKHDSYSRAKNITAPTLVIVAEYDEVINRKNTMKLIEAFDSRIDVHVIEGAGHNTISNYSAYFEQMTRFIN